MEWQDVGHGLGYTAWVDAMVVYDDQLIVGGKFDTVGTDGLIVESLARWYLHPDSVTWGVPDDIIEHTMPLNGKIQVYPNPNTGRFTIELPATSYLPIVITDLAGRQLYFEESEGRKTLEVSLDYTGFVLISVLQNGRLTSTTRVLIH